MSTDLEAKRDRRSFLTALAPLSAGLIIVGCGRGEEGGGGMDVTPTEDLMREHGLLNRVLLIYDEVATRIDGGTDFPTEALVAAVGVIQTFVEEYHEKMEEEFLFPRFEKAGKLVDLVKVLRCQHTAGRRGTAEILHGTRPGALATHEERVQLATMLRSFNRMYRPHEAREDTVLFPALRSIVSAHEFGAIGEDFEKREHQLFGKDGFEGMVDKVDSIERMFGIEGLERFTPGSCE